MEEMLEQAAKTAHEVNRAYCKGLGDDSQLLWTAAAEWQKISAREGVRFIRGHPSAPASAQHEAWFDQKKLDGWKFGAVKNLEKKEHPCMVPYDSLPVSQRAKDFLFQATVRGILGMSMP